MCKNQRQIQTVQDRQEVEKTAHPAVRPAQRQPDEPVERTVSSEGERQQS